MDLIKPLMGTLVVEKSVYHYLFQNWLLPGIVSSIKKGKLIIRHKGCLTETGEGEPCATIVIRDEVRFTKALLFRGEIGLGESYTEGVWHADDNLFPLLLLFLKNEHHNGGLKRYRMALKWNFGTDRENISYHYDAPGNEFFKLFLTDPYQAYSCGFFISELDTLDEAQKRKVHYIIQKLHLKGMMGARIMDVGCGWGYIMDAISKKTGSVVTGVTLSENQKDWIQKKICVRNPNIQVFLMPFIDMEEPATPEEGYDAIYSIGMFEHVRQENYVAFFAKVSRLLKPDGRLVLHTIINSRDTSPASFHKNDTFVTTHIFPGGQIPCRSWINDAVEKTDLKIHHTELFGGQHYAKTLSEWAMRLRWAKDHIEELYGHKQYLLYEYYMMMCQASFTVGNMELAHFVISKGDLLSIEKGFIYM